MQSRRPAYRQAVTRETRMANENWITNEAIAITDTDRYTNAHINTHTHTLMRAACEKHHRSARLVPKAWPSRHSAPSPSQFPCRSLSRLLWSVPAWEDTPTQQATSTSYMLRWTNSCDDAKIAHNNRRNADSSSVRALCLSDLNPTTLPPHYRLTTLPPYRLWHLYRPATVPTKVALGRRGLCLTATCQYPIRVGV